MSEQQQPLTLEGLFEYLRQSDLQMQEFRRESQARAKELDRQMQATDRKIAALGSRVGQIVENMIGGDIINQFRALGYEVTSLYRNRIFGKIGTTEQGEIDLILEDGDVAILIEVKVNLQTDDARDHVKRLEKFRRYRDSRPVKDNCQYIGAVAGAVIEPNVTEFAQKPGMYVIVQSIRLQYRCVKKRTLALSLHGHIQRRDRAALCKPGSPTACLPETE